MSLSRETMLELMALADGELEGEDARRGRRSSPPRATRRGAWSRRCARPSLGAWLRRRPGRAGRGRRRHRRRGDGQARERPVATPAIEGVVRLSDARAKRSRFSRGQVAVVRRIPRAGRDDRSLHAQRPRRGPTGPRRWRAWRRRGRAERRSAALRDGDRDGPGGALSRRRAWRSTRSTRRRMTSRCSRSPARAAAQASGPTPPSVVIMIEDEPGDPMMRRTLLAARHRRRSWPAPRGSRWANPPRAPSLELTIIHATYVDGGRLDRPAPARPPAA